jgi:hypothetical protein
VGDAFVAFAKAYKAAKADGWQTGTDLPGIILACAPALMKAFDGVKEGDVAGAVKVFALAGADVWAELKPAA